MMSSTRLLIALMCLVAGNTACDSIQAQSTPTPPPIKPVAKDAFANPFERPDQPDAGATETTPKDVNQLAGNEQENRLFRFVSVEIDEQDDRLERLLKERYNIAVAELEARLEEYRRGLSAVNVVCVSAMRVLVSEREIVKDPKRHAESFAKFVELATLIEQFAELNLNSGTGTVQELFQARYLRLDAEIQQLRHQRGLKTPGNESQDALDE